ncbi:MAG TPA: amino acid adenylation domain-containing protein, partial [Thermoanaerobaculia bacterium]|nr:amino acid adenylation domain-containing protein [Thermoanaerobaculia bacterium]
EAERWLAGEVRVPLSFAAPLFRTSLLRLGAREHLLLILTHHIVWDDWSRGVLVRDLAAFYCASSAGKASPLPPLPVQYADFALWQRRWLECEDREQHLAYWRRQLDGAPRHLDLPTDRPRPAEQSFRGGELTRRIPAALAERVRVLARHQGSTVFMTLAAAFQVLLCRYSGQRDIVVGTLTGNRNLPEIEDLIGFFVNTLPLRTDLSGDPDFVSVLTRMREAALAAYDHQDLPFDQLVEALKLPRDLGHNPLTQVVFNMFNAGIPAVEIPGLALDLVSTPLGWAPFDLVVTVSSGEGELVCETLFAADLYDPSTVRRLLRHFEILLRGIVAEPARPVAELPLLSAGERGQILLEWNDTGSIFPRDEPIHRIFQAYAEKAPDATGITCGGRSLSYGEIDARANQLARHLRALGVGQELPVGVLAERSPEAVIAILAILKAEGAYVPLDPDEPRERLRSIVEDARMPLLLVTRGKWLDLLPEAAVRQVCLERDQLEIARWSREDLGDPPTPADSLAYVMYTSGSSGRPKGVCVPHRAVVRLVRGVGYAGFGPGEVFLSLAPISFDASTFEIWGALLNGGRLAIFSPQVPSLDELSETVEREGVSTLWLTAGLFHQMVEGRLEGLRPLRQLLAGGDVLSPRQVRQALAHLPGLRLINGYGPTEATTFTCCCPMAHPDEVGPSVSIGRPIGNTRVYLLAPDLALVPVGVAGELFIGGDGLARAYLNSPAATAERFVPDPFGKEAGMRLYRTGDRARYLADGRIEFLGRLDNQVKIRGFRVELGEIEAVLGQHPGIREAAVVVREDGSGHRRLVGYITVREGDPTGELPQFLRQRLPDYMVPGTVVVLDSLPLSPNGKVDRRALPAADAAAPSPAEGYVAPRNPAEETLASIWREILKLDRVGVHDNFFALGGDSILAIQIVARAYDAGLELSPTQLFHHQTIAELAAPALAAEAVSGRPIVQEAAGPAPLTPIQRWFFDLELPEPHHFNHSVLLDVAPDLDKAVLASAVAHLVTRHDALRLSFFKPRGEGWLQVVREPGSAAAPFSHLALSSLPPERRRSTLEAAAAALQSSLDLTAGPLLRAGLFEMGEGEPCRLLFVVHHLAVDGVSWRILLADLAATCRRL